MGLVARASFTCLAVPRYARVGADPLPVLCLLRKGLILQGRGQELRTLSPSAVGTCLLPPCPRLPQRQVR